MIQDHLVFQLPSFLRQNNLPKQSYDASQPYIPLEVHMELLHGVLGGHLLRSLCGRQNEGEDEGPSEGDVP